MRLSRSLAGLSVALGMMLGVALSGAASPVTAQGVVTVEMINNRFVPAAIEVAAGTTVVFANTDPSGEQHDVVAAAGAFSSPLLSVGQSYEVYFGNPGSYEYYCTLHEGMYGLVVVR